MATQERSATPPAGWYDNPTGPGERYWDGSQWTEDYRQPDWTVVRLKGPHASGAPPFRSPPICCACGSPAGTGVLEKRNRDAGHMIATLVFPLCDRCAAIHDQKPAGSLAPREEKEAWKARKEEWERVDDAVRFKFDSRGDKATFEFRNPAFAQGFEEATLNPPKPASEELLLHAIDAHRGRFTGDLIPGLAVSPDSSWIATASSDKKVKLWDVESGAEIRTLEGHKQPLTTCVVGPDGTWIASVSTDGITVWDVASGEERCTFEKEREWSTGCAVGPDGTWAVSSNDKALVFWDPRTGEELRRLEKTDVGRVPMAVAPDGSWILVTAGKKLSLVDPETGADRIELTGHRKAVTACAISPDGAWIVSGGKDGALKVWDASNGAELLGLDGHNRKVTGCAVSPDGAWILSSGDDGTLRVWDATGGNEIATMRVGGILSCAWSPNGAWFAAGDSEGRLKIWDARIFDAAPPSAG